MNGILLSWTIPIHLVMGSLLGPMTLMRDLPLILFLIIGDYTQRTIQTLSILDGSSIPLTPTSSPRTNPHVVVSNQHVVNNDTPDYERCRPYFGWVNIDTVQKTMEQSTQWRVSIPNTFPMKKHLNLGIHT